MPRLITTVLIIVIRREDDERRLLLVAEPLHWAGDAVELIVKAKLEG